MDISISCQNRSLFYLCIGSFREFLLDYPCLCLCLGLEQITLIRPRRRIRRHFSQILRTEALIFIFVIPYLNFECTSWKKKKFSEILNLESYIPSKEC